MTLASLLAIASDSEPPEPSDSDSSESESASLQAPRRVFETQVNDYGVYRQYIGSFPSHVPDDFISLTDLCNSPILVQPSPQARHQSLLSSYTASAEKVSSSKFFVPFPNPTTFRLMHWFHSVSNVKSYGELDRLVADVILSEDFDPKDLKNFSSEREARRLDSHQDKTSPIFTAKDGWVSAAVPIRVPAERFIFKSESDAPVFLVEGLHYRKITEVVQSALQESNNYHFVPFKQYFKSSANASPERIYSEIYDSDTMIAEHQTVQSWGPPKCKLERFVIAILLWSDSTNLASFGTASLWPIYLFIGNLSKYIRGKPSSLSAHHLAYIPKLGDKFQDFY